MTQFYDKAISNLQALLSGYFFFFFQSPLMSVRVAGAAAQVIWIRAC